MSSPTYHSRFFLITLHSTRIHIYPFNTHVLTLLGHLDEEIPELLGGWLQIDLATTLYSYYDQRLY
jgi:hypothetical protein